MIDPQSATALQAIVRRESRSLLQYVGESFPWTRANELVALADLRQLIAEENHSTQALGKYLLARHVRLPFFSAYPSVFTNVNFVALDFVLPRLVELQAGAIAALDADLSRIRDDETRELVQKHLDMKRRHLKKLTELTAACIEPAKV